MRFPYTSEVLPLKTDLRAKYKVYLFRLPHTKMLYLYIFRRSTSPYVLYIPLKRYKIAVKAFCAVIHTSPRQQQIRG